MRLAADARNVSFPNAEVPAAKRSGLASDVKFLVSKARLATFIIIITFSHVFKKKLN